MRIAVIDIGTNTTRLYAAELDGRHITEELIRVSRVTRLGAGVDASSRLADDSLAREYVVLEDYRRALDELDPDRAVAVMTSAVRDAVNGPEFARAVELRFGLETHILSGDEEARLTYTGATDTLNVSGDTAPTLVFDIGGGSTELVIGHAQTLDFHVSAQAGVVRQADRHITADPPTPREIDAVARDVREILEAAVPPARRTGLARALGVAGTPTSLAAIAQRLDPYDPSRVHGYRLSAAERDAIFAQLSTMPLSDRQQVPGLHPDRAIAIIPGIVILKVVMDLFGLSEIEVSEHDILRGSAIHYASGD
jgi:exopolyphosphatase/guanosine-5'-triphosphate,3'-diphosphate pyrophosphatase